MLLLRQLSSLSKAPSKTLVELYFDILSPYSYLQFELINRQRPQWSSMNLKYIPVSIVTVFGNSENQPPMMVPAKGAYLLHDLSRVSKFLQIPFRMRNDFAEFAMTLGSLNTQQFLQALQPLLTENQQEQVIGSFFRKFFNEPSINLSDLNELQNVAAEVGITQDVIQKAIAEVGSDNAKKLIKENSKKLTDLGGFGLPTTVLHLPSGPQFIFGSDRIHLIGHMLGESKPPILYPSKA